MGLDLLYLQLLVRNMISMNWWLFSSTTNRNSSKAIICKFSVDFDRGKMILVASLRQQCWILIGNHWTVCTCFLGMIFFFNHNFINWQLNICRLMLKPEVFLFVQPNIYVYHWWGYCWNFGIYWLDWICLLFPCHDNYFNRTHGKGWVYDPFILWFVEPDYIWRHSGWAYGTHLDHLLLIDGLFHVMFSWSYYLLGRLICLMRRLPRVFFCSRLELYLVTLILWN